MANAIPTTHNGIPLLPRPQGADDPLRWPKSIKLAALFASAMTNFTANFAASGLSVAQTIIEAQFNKTANEFNTLMTLNFLLLGIGNLFWVPFAVKFGKRASLITSTTLLLAVLLWSANATTFNQLLAARCISGFASAAGESIVPGVVSDIFFLHERAGKMSFFTILIAGASAVGPLVASFIVQYSPGTWVDYMWVCVALAAFNVVLLIFALPESNYHREKPEAADNGVETQDIEIREPKSQAGSTDAEKVDSVEVQEDENPIVVHKPWSSIWPTFITLNKSQGSFLHACLRQLTHALYPDVLFAIFVYGSSLASQIILIFAFPSLLLAPPYLFQPTGVGLMQVAAIIGLLIATFLGGYLVDVMTQRIVVRHRGEVFPEQRLLTIIPGCLVAPVGCILAAFACGQKMHWAVIAVAFGMVSFGTVYTPNIAATFVVEGHPDHAEEALVAINVFKNLVAFLFLYTAVDWIQSQGWIQVYMIMFMLVSLSMLAAIPLYLFRKPLRSYRSKIDKLL
ncbi:hypothetical protein MCOR25_007917 [Pyricularia grisea]|uniref:Major facilitator superfamily (MFS) profile domain-containing protein n=1 Tax=Pyricularia grisea TaxID=148305 RepID=A0A6P8BFL5_PYRGI|nr:uncharacterized protein PgNI_02144 [Pyricularia grisea]KAI6356227.1 hypothetical protein MCOR25_007917 [Pyricularia grisea]TLD15424.1 hypothetical protein PgNI_02144 [Pyricularia grisea]